MGELFGDDRIGQQEKHVACNCENIGSNPGYGGLLLRELFTFILAPTILRRSVK